MSMCVHVRWQLLELPHFHLNGLISLVLLNIAPGVFKSVVPFWRETKFIVVQKSTYTDQEFLSDETLVTAAQSFTVRSTGLVSHGFVFCVEGKVEVLWAMAGLKKNPIRIRIWDSLPWEKNHAWIHIWTDCEQVQFRNSLSSPQYSRGLRSPNSKLVGFWLWLSIRGECQSSVVYPNFAHLQSPWNSMKLHSNQKMTYELKDLGRHILTCYSYTTCKTHSTQHTYSMKVSVANYERDGNM